MSLFNYIFYRICSFYEKKELDKTNPEIYASAIISGMQLSVFLFLLSISNLIKLNNKEEFMLLFIPLSIIVMVINLFFVFTKNKYKIVKTQWENENRKSAFIKGLLIVFWIILIFPLVIGSIHFFKS
ncbi:hypothetical protein [Prevotella sp. 10(H)]|uniref:hypothetical protein n=1 Tax=Prevotella sp. 10(H) TaxID=1158294 RepID=UPI0004A6D1CB|nr:hypothetical protein [Prevotella sp. 10(H)]